MPRVKRPWFLLSTHGLVLVTISRYPDLTVVEIARQVGLGKVTVLRALKDLKDAGMLEIGRQGRRNVYRVNKKVNFRHPVMQDSYVGDLLDIFSEPAPAAARVSR